jgi:adenylate kinase
MKVIILLGAPGAGKGTVAEKIREATKYIHVSTGDMLREAVKKGSEVGREAEAYMKRGELVPDSVIIKLVEERLDKGKSEDAYMFDGFPRTPVQAELLDKSLSKRGSRVGQVFFLDAPRKVLIERLTGRRTCRKCGRNFHIVNIPPKKAGVCDSCGGELYQRPDDSEATIVNRLDVYNKQTESLISRYEGQGTLARVDSNQSAGKLVEEIVKILGR